MRTEHQILLIKFVIDILLNSTVSIVYYSVKREVLSHHSLKYLHNSGYPYYPIAQFKSKCFEYWADEFKKIPGIHIEFDKEEK